MGKSANFAHRPMSALALFRSGLDTLEIGKILRLPEAQVVRDLDRQRSTERELPIPYRQRD